MVGLVAAVGIVAFAFWLFRDPTDNFQVSMPGADNRQAGTLVQEIVRIGEHFNLFGNKAPEMNGSWPRFRGANFDNIVSEKQNLKESLGSR